MTVETATKISQLNPLGPPGSDPKSEGDNHLRLLKSTLQAVFNDSGTTIKTTLPIESPGPAKITGDLAVSGNLAISGNETITGSLTAGSIVAAPITGNADVGGTLHVVGAATFDAAVLMKLGAIVYQSLALAQTATPANKATFDVTALSAPHVVRVPNIDSVTGIWEPIAERTLTGNNAIVTDLSAYDVLKFGISAEFGGTAPGVFVQLSEDNGTTWISGTNMYIVQQLAGSGTSASSGQLTSNTSIALTSGNKVATGPTNMGLMADVTLHRFNKAKNTQYSARIGYQVTSALTLVSLIHDGAVYRQVAANAVQFILDVGGTWAGLMTVEGLRG